MPAKTPTKGKKAAAPKTPKKAATKAKKPPLDDEEELALDASDDEELDDEELEDEEGEEEEEAPRAAKAPAAKKPTPARAKPGTGDEAPAVVPARRLTPEAKARVNEMVRKGMSLGDALKAAAAWETFVAPVKDEPAKLVQGRMSGSGEPRSSFVESEHEEDEPLASDED